MHAKHNTEDSSLVPTTCSLETMTQKNSTTCDQLKLRLDVDYTCIYISHPLTSVYRGNQIRTLMTND